MKTAHHRFAVAILALLVLPVPAWDAVAEEDPIKAELDAARTAYEKTVAAAKVAFLKTFDAELKKSAAAGDLDGYKELHADKEKTKAKNLPRSTLEIPADRPNSDPLHDHQLTYTDKVRMARSTLAAALDAGVKKYTMKVEIEKATAVQKEWRSLLSFRAMDSKATRVLTYGFRMTIKEDKNGYMKECKIPRAGPGRLLYSGWHEYFHSLNTLRIYNPEFMEHCNDVLKDLGVLKRLTLMAPMKDADLGQLKHLTSLRNLTLRHIDNKLTNAGIKNLQKALPKCEIEWSTASP